MAWWGDEPKNENKGRGMFSQPADAIGPFGKLREVSKGGGIHVQPTYLSVGIPGNLKDGAMLRLRRGEHVPDWELWAAGIDPQTVR